MRRSLDAKGKAMIFLLVVIAGLIAWMALPIHRFADTSYDRQAEAIEQAWDSAALQCYALEGAYPPNLEYLAEHYNLFLDREHFYYRYEIFASNVRPEIEVVPRLYEGR